MPANTSRAALKSFKAPINNNTRERRRCEPLWSCASCIEFGLQRLGRGEEGKNRTSAVNRARRR
jgi:hypothetical protein